MTTDGELKIIHESATGCDPLARYQLATRPTWAHLAAVDRRIIVKDATALSARDMGGRR